MGGIIGETIASIWKTQVLEVISLSIDHPFDRKLPGKWCMIA